MLFNSIEFAIFFPTVCILYFLLPGKYRTLLILIASCGFYMAFIPAYILILFTTILVDFYAGIWIEEAKPARKKPILWVSVVVTCLILFVFKYFYFFTDTFINVAGIFGWSIDDPALKIILPIGLSFHTFQSLSYVIEVYRGEQKAEKDFITYATYVMFFPQLVAGPIERPQNLIHQFHEFHAFDYERITSGLRRMAWGFFKKLVVADRLAVYVNDVYSNPQAHNGLQLTIATWFFAYQIYCDFSGYSDIAVGSARVLGFKLMNNFDTPYWSSSISEFWRRWHVSLSTWFRDYVYVPMGGSKVSTPQWSLNILVTFGVSGLWHGASWTYVIWGLLNGFYLIFGRLTSTMRDRLWVAIAGPGSDRARKFLAVPITFFLVSIAWVFFRTANWTDAMYILGHFWRDWDFGVIKTQHFQLKHFPVAIAAIFILEIAQLLQKRYKLLSMTVRLPQPLRWATYIIMVLFVLLSGVFQSEQFIYFQF